MSKHINIVYYHDALIPNHSKKVFEVLIRRLIATVPIGSKVTILCQSFDCDPELQNEYRAADFIFVNTSRKFQLRSVIAKQLLQIFSSNDREATVIVNMMNVYTVWIWSILSRIYGGISICRFTGLKPIKKRNFIKRLSRDAIIYLSFNISHHIVAVSENLGDFVKNIASSRKVSVISQGVASVFLNAKSDDEPSVGNTSYVFVGRLVKNKGIVQLVRAFLQLDETCRSLKIVGHGPLYGEIESMIQGHENITLCGSKSQIEIARILASSSALILPSDHEGTPNVLLEAMASRTFVLATDVGESGKLIGTDRGLLLRSNSVSDIKEGIYASEAIANRHEYLERAYDLVSAEYAETVTRDRLNNIIEPLVNREYS